MYDEVTSYSELLISDNWYPPGLSHGNYYTSLSYYLASPLKSMLRLFYYWLAPRPTEINKKNVRYK